MGRSQRVPLLRRTVRDGRRSAAPLVVILGVAAFETRSKVWRTVVPLSLLGTAIAAYHSVLQLTTTSCTFSGSCAVVQWRLPVLGMSIPNLSLTAFLLITIAVIGGTVAGKAE